MWTGPTDVLSFPEFDLRPGSCPRRRTQTRGRTYPLGTWCCPWSGWRPRPGVRPLRRRELAYLVTHSVLHLLGYDHLDEGAMKKQMRWREEAIVACWAWSGKTSEKENGLPQPVRAPASQ